MQYQLDEMQTKSVVINGYGYKVPLEFFFFFYNGMWSKRKPFESCLATLTMGQTTTGI